MCVFSFFSSSFLYIEFRGSAETGAALSPKESRLDHNATLIHSLLSGGSSGRDSNPRPSKFPPKDNVAEIIIKHAKRLLVKKPSNYNVERLRNMGVWKN
jgi:hypothetical protein